MENKPQGRRSAGSTQRQVSSAPQRRSVSGAPRAVRSTASRAQSQSGKAPSRSHTASASAGHARQPRGSQGKSQLTNAKAASSNGLWTKQASASRKKQKSSMDPGLHRILTIVVVVVLVIGGLTLFDNISNANKIYQGIKVGSVNVGGMTKEQAVTALRQEYGDKIANGKVIIYAGDEGKKASATQQQGSAERDDRSVQEVAAETTSWAYSVNDLGAWLPAEDLVEQAYQWGRGDILQRMQATFFGQTIEALLTIEKNHLQSVVSSITATMGYELKDWNVITVAGTATVKEGHDGMMPDSDELVKGISKAILESKDGNGEYIATVQKTPVRITEQQAQSLADQINAAIADGVDFVHDAITWHADSTQLSDWLSTEVVEQPENSKNYKLVPVIDEGAVRATLLKNVVTNVDTSSVTVAMERVNDQIVVRPSGDSSIPDTATAASQLAGALFGLNGQAAHEGAKAADGMCVTITFGNVSLPETMSLDEALSYGIIELISKYTTEYTNTAYTTARNNNIHLAAAEINMTTVGANGGIWSYNDIAGDSTEEEGFQSAGTIIDGNYSESIGGGLCQVATTVFNCIYESGFAILERHNHALYISSYPAGRDAAINYNTEDLIWRNDTNSDCVLMMDYTDTTVTASLYGVNPRYKVTTETGDWKEGKDYKITVKEDESLAKGQKYVDTTGVDGSEISVTRRVYEQDGTLVSTKTFTSVYSPRNEVIVCGPGTEVDTDRHKDDED